MKIKYNAPVILTFALLSALIFLIATVTGSEAVLRLFSVPGNQGGFRFLSADFVRLFTHVLGHGSWVHLLSNITFILLIGPISEEKYGSLPILFMVLITAVVTGLLNVLLFPTGLLGASGVVFMLILLVSFTNINAGEVPLTFILVVLLFITKEVLGAFENNNISEFAHIAGGICGGLFGFAFRKKRGDLVQPGIETPENGSSLIDPPGGPGGPD